MAHVANSNLPRENKTIFGFDLNRYPENSSPQEQVRYWRPAPNALRSQHLKKDSTYPRKDRNEVSWLTSDERRSGAGSWQGGIGRWRNRYLAYRRLANTRSQGGTKEVADMYLSWRWSICQTTKNEQKDKFKWWPGKENPMEAIWEVWDLKPHSVCCMLPNSRSFLLEEKA